MVLHHFHSRWLTERVFFRLAAKSALQLNILSNRIMPFHRIFSANAWQLIQQKAFFSIFFQRTLVLQPPKFSATARIRHVFADHDPCIRRNHIYMRGGGVASTDPMARG